MDRTDKSDGASALHQRLTKGVWRWLSALIVLVALACAWWVVVRGTARLESTRIVSPTGTPEGGAVEARPSGWVDAPKSFEEERQAPSRSEADSGSAQGIPQESWEIAGPTEHGNLEEIVRVHGRVLRGEEPVADYDLSFHLTGGGIGEAHDWDFTDRKGRYAVELRPARYVVSADDGGPWLANLDVGGEAAQLVFDIVLPKGVIRGVVRGPTEEGIQAARIIASRVDAVRGDPMTRLLRSRGGTACSGEDGGFVLSELHPGSYELLAVATGLQATTQRVSVTDVPSDGLVELVLSAGASLHGIVTGSHGWPDDMYFLVCPGPQIASLSELLLRGRHRLEKDGSFTIEGLAPGPYVLLGVGESDEGQMFAHAQVDFQPGQPPLVVTVQRCGSLLVRVVRSDGSPVRGASLDLRASDGATVFGSRRWMERGPTTDKDGVLLLDDVMPGDYRVAVSYGGESGPPERAKVRSSKTTKIQLRLE